MFLFTPTWRRFPWIIQQCSKCWLVVLYRGLYYPLVWGFFQKPTKMIPEAFYQSAQWNVPRSTWTLLKLTWYLKYVWRVIILKSLQTNIIFSSFHQTAKGFHLDWAKPRFCGRSCGLAFGIPWHFLFGSPSPCLAWWHGSWFRHLSTDWSQH